MHFYIDWSKCEKYIQYNCGGYELLFWDVAASLKSSAKKGKQESKASVLKDVDWHTWTCVLGWPVQGIWPSRSDGTDINAVCRSQDTSLLATSDDFGKLKIFRYPVNNKDAAFSELVGHSSHVTNVRFAGEKDSDYCKHLFMILFY